MREQKNIENQGFADQPSWIEETEVQVTIALSEDGNVEVMVWDRCHVQKKQAYDQWIERIRSDTRFWSLKTITTMVVYPGQKETIK